MTNNNLLPPTLEQVGDIWRVTYAGMVKEHKQDWQAQWHYQQACDMYLSARGSDD
jgi:hypothetical protein